MPLSVTSFWTAQLQRCDLDARKRKGYSRGHRNQVLDRPCGKRVSGGGTSPFVHGADNVRCQPRHVQPFLNNMIANDALQHHLVLRSGNDSTAAAGSFANAALVGANMVNGPGPERVPQSSRIDDGTGKDSTRGALVPTGRSVASAHTMKNWDGRSCSVMK